MTKERVAIPEALAVQVIFESDRTCCVCRLEKQKVQIHHIDSDPSNNAIENLAVLCLHCHSEAHSTGAFVRSLTPELVRLYNLSWRDVVRLRLKPPPADTGRTELAAEAYLEASLDAHGWKNQFMSLAMSGGLPEGQPGQFADVWDLMIGMWIPKYSNEIYRLFLPLLDQGVREWEIRSDRLIQIFPDVLAADFRAILVRASRHLGLQRYVYLRLLQMMGPGKTDDQINPLFNATFSEVVRTLANVAREADRRREALTAL